MCPEVFCAGPVARVPKIEYLSQKSEAPVCKVSRTLGQVATPAMGGGRREGVRGGGGAFATHHPRGLLLVQHEHDDAVGALGAVVLVQQLQQTPVPVPGVDHLNHLRRPPHPPVVLPASTSPSTADVEWLLPVIATVMIVTKCT